jgi:hypothetical protein
MKKYKNATNRSWNSSGILTSSWKNGYIIMVGFTKFHWCTGWKCSNHKSRCWKNNSGFLNRISI